MLNTPEEAIPMGSRVLLKRCTQNDNRTDAGVYLPDTAKKQENWFEVVTIGLEQDEKGNPIHYPVSVGDIVMTTSYGGVPVLIGEETYILAQVSDIILVKR